MKVPLLVHRSILMLLTVAVSLALGGYAASAHDHETGASCGGDHLHHHHFAEFAKAPEKARMRPNPLENDPDAVAAGRKLFAQHCSECHGSAAEGGRKAPNLHAEEVQNATPGTLFWVLTNGVVRSGMPVWSKLPEPQRWQIVTYLRTLKKSDAGQ
jgi:mono/diheme cytochrome c family protein